MKNTLLKLCALLAVALFYFPGLEAAAVKHDKRHAITKAARKHESKHKRKHSKESKHKSKHSKSSRTYSYIERVSHSGRPISRHRHESYSRSS